MEHLGEDPAFRALILGSEVKDAGASLDGVQEPHDDRKGLVPGRDRMTLVSKYLTALSIAYGE